MTRVNLIPPGIRYSQRRRGHLKRWAFSLATVATAVGVSLSVEALRRAQANDLRTQSGQLQAELESTRQETRTVTGAASRVLERIERAKALRGKRAWSGLFTLIDSCIPAGCWLTRVASDPAAPGSGPRRQAPPPAPEGSTEQPRAITIEAPSGIRLAGYAAGAAEPLVFVSNLKASGVFTDVTLAHSQREPVLDGLFYQFELVCAWEP